MAGFLEDGKRRQPIFGERVPGKLGYTERDVDGREWFQDLHGRRIARYSLQATSGTSADDQPLRWLVRASNLRIAAMVLQ